jgi:hypothetical protein
VFPPQQEVQTLLAFVGGGRIFFGLYCLSASHPRGRHKARVFREALGVQQSDAARLREDLLEAARTEEAFETAADVWGTHWRFDAVVAPCLLADLLVLHYVPEAA